MLSFLSDGQRPRGSVHRIALNGLERRMRAHVGQRAGSRPGSGSNLETSGMNSLLRSAARFGAGLVALAVFTCAPPAGLQDALRALSGRLTDSTGALIPGTARTVEGKLCYANGVPCLNSSHFVRFSVSGSNTPFVGPETARGSRAIQFSNGRAEISIVFKGEYRIKAKRKGLPVASLKL